MRTTGVDGWSPTVSAGWYTALATVLATAALTALVLVLTNRAKALAGSDKKDREAGSGSFALQAAVRLLVGAFFTSTIAAYGNGLIAGEAERLTRPVFEMVGSTVLLTLAAVQIMAAIYWIVLGFSPFDAPHAATLFRGFMVAAVLPAFMSLGDIIAIVRPHWTGVATVCLTGIAAVVGTMVGVWAPRRDGGVVALNRAGAHSTMLTLVSITWVLIINLFDSTSAIGGLGTQDPADAEAYLPATFGRDAAIAILALGALLVVGLCFVLFTISSMVVVGLSLEDRIIKYRERMSRKPKRRKKSGGRKKSKG